MSADLIDDAVRQCGLSETDIDYFALCTTQSMGDGGEVLTRPVQRAGFKPIHKIIETSIPRLPNTDEGPSLCVNLEIQSETPKS